MVSFFSLAALLAGSILARADVLPSTPDTANAGSTCVVSWAGDTYAFTSLINLFFVHGLDAWYHAEIQRPTGQTWLLSSWTGDNEAMVFLTTVATGLDGTTSGSYSWKCPEVEPYSAIYFYQFISPLETENKAWTTRFAIASPSGTTTAPPNATQPDGSQIAWGTGALVNAVVSSAPSFAPDVTLGTVITSAVSSTASSLSSSPRVTSAAVAASAKTGANKAAATSTSANSGLGLTIDKRAWTTAFGAVGSIMLAALFF